MLIMIFLYAILLLFFSLKIVSGYPIATFLLANSFYLIITLPCALAYYIIFVEGDRIWYGSFWLDSLSYSVLFCLQVVVVFLGYVFYRFGYQGVMCGSVRTFYFIKTGTLSFFLFAILSFVISVSVVLYVHASFGFTYLFAPRRLYELSRDGFGLHYFIFGFFLRLSAILILFSRFRFRLAFLVFLFFFSIFTGAKVNSYVILMISLFYYFVFVERGILRFRIILLFSLILAPMVLLLLKVTFLSSNVNIFLLLVAYANEPWNNFILLVQTFVDRFDSLFFGSIWLENNIVSRIPRFLFEGKPYVYGGFRIANEYFPENVALGLGAPSFGQEGMYFVDFGYFGLFLQVCVKCILFWFLGRFSAISIKFNPGLSVGKFYYFSLILICSNIYLVILPPSNNLFDNFLIFAFLGVFFGVRRYRYV